MNMAFDASDRAGQAEAPSAATRRAAVRQQVERTILEVAAENTRAMPQITDDLLLMESGLDSLCLAVIVAKLEDELGVDPFATADDMIFPSTIGDFIKLYEDAVA